MIPRLMDLAYGVFRHLLGGGRNVCSCDGANRGVTLLLSMAIGCGNLRFSSLRGFETVFPFRFL